MMLEAIEDNEVCKKEGVEKRKGKNEDAMLGNTLLSDRQEGEES